MLSETEFQKRLERIRCFALDLDGTVYLGNTLFDFTPEFLDRLSETDRSYLFITNNSSLTPGQYAEKFLRLGLQIAEEKIYTSADATLEYLLNKGPGHRLFIMGTDHLIKFFERHGFILEPDNPDAVVLAFDLDFDYSRLNHATRLLRKGVPFFATHPDLTCPIENGEVLPDCGALAAALTAATRVRPVFLGKPYPPMVNGMLRRAAVSRQELAIVGDRLSTDIRTGVENGVLSILVLTGETKEDDLANSDIQPDFFLPSLGDLLRFL